MQTDNREDILDEEDDLFIGDDAHEGDLAGGEDEDIDFTDDGSKLDDETRKFDRIVGALADVLMDPTFEEMRESFCRSNCEHFEDNDENKLIYTQLFEQYVSLMETTIDRRLSAAVPDFSMQAFSELLARHKDQLMDEVFDLLLSLGDFEAFKDVMLSYKRETEEGNEMAGLGISCSAMRVYSQEQEDGDERPDLDLGLTVTSIRS